MTTKPKRQRKETRVGQYWQKPSKITRDEAMAAQRDRGIYLESAKIAAMAKERGWIKIPGNGVI